MEIKRFGNIEGKTMMLLHGNLMCWQQFEDLIPLLERKFCVYAVSFDGFDGTGETTYTTARDQADKLAAYIEKELDGQLDLLFAESLGCGSAVFLRIGCFSEDFSKHSDWSDDPQRAGVSGFRGAESTDLEGYATKAVSNGTRKVHACMGTALYGADGAGNADHAPPYPGSYQLGIRPGHLGGRTLSLSNGLFGTARCKGRLLVRRKRRAHEKGHPAAADGISGSDGPLLPGFWPWRYHQSSGTACVGAGTLSGGRRDSGRCAAESGK